MWEHYYRPTSLDQALTLLAERPSARLVAGGTDLTVELRRGVRPTDTLVDLTAIAELRYVRLADGQVRIGALATHNDIVAAPFATQILPLAQACREIGAPQIRTAATVAGNIVTASPANDTIPALIALDASVELLGRGGVRVVPLREFYHGVRKTALQPGEILREIRVPALGAQHHGLFLKLGLRRAQAISVVNAAVVIAGAVQEGGFVVEQATVALGCVAPTILRPEAAEVFLVGQTLDASVCAEAGRLAAEASRPIDDLRGSARYRRDAVAALVTQALERIAGGREAVSWEAAPVLLETQDPRSKPGAVDHQLTTSRNQPSSIADRPSSEIYQLPATGYQPVTAIDTTINGEPVLLEDAQSLTLLDALRYTAGLTGTKEGCAEGECGACTVWLNGRAVMSCLTPAAQAQGAQVTTIEGLSDDDELHPVQRSFIEQGAVQCGFCTPGMIMAAAQLLAEHPHPTEIQIQTAISGNLCRCTGYKQIQRALQSAAGMIADQGS